MILVIENIQKIEHKVSPMDPSTNKPPSTNTEVQPSSTDRDVSCRSCLYTGVATCIGLSAYFFHLAFECTEKEKESSWEIIKPRAGTQQSPVHSNGAKEGHAHTMNRSSIGPKCRKAPSDIHNNIWLNTLRKASPPSYPNPKANRPFLLTFSAFWAAAGAYRYYLD